MSRFAGFAALLLASIAAAPARILAFQIAASTGSETQQPSNAAAFEAAARRFRLQVYQTFRTDRAEFERRREAGEQILADWHQAGKRSDDEAAMIRWFEEAAFRSRPEVRGPLPEFPRFGSRGASAERFKPPAPRPSQADSTRPHRPTPVAGPSPSRASQIAPRLPVTFTPAAPGGTGSPPSDPYSSTAGPDGATLRSIGAAAPQNLGAPTPSEQVKSPARLRGIARPLGAIVADAPTITAAPDRTAAKALRPSEPHFVGGHSVLNGPSTHQVDQGPLNRDTPLSPPNPRSADARPSAAATAPPHRMALAKPSLSVTDRSVPELVATPSAVAAPVEVTADFNVGELLARASGYNVGLRTVDSVLQEGDELSTTDLARLLAELEFLLNQRHDLLLYEQLIADTDRARLVRSLTFPQTTVAGLGTRIAKARERLAARSGADAAARANELQTLEELSLRLSRVVQE